MDRLGSFRSHSITDIQTLVESHYAFRKQSNTSTYIVDLLDKDRYFYDDIENIGNWGHVWDNISNNTTGPRAIFADVIVIIFYKMAHNTRLIFNLLTIKFFDLFCHGMLAFLFAMIHCDISEY